MQPRFAPLDLTRDPLVRALLFPPQDLLPPDFRELTLGTIHPLPFTRPLPDRSSQAASLLVPYRADDPFYKLIVL